jgi:conjugal transfer pilus assembly protein TraK
MSTSTRAARRPVLLAMLALPALTLPGIAHPGLAKAQSVTALPDQVSTIRLSNRDINHVICAAGEIEDVKYSSEKAIAVEKAGADAWIKFLVRETDDAGMITRSYVTTPSEFFVACGGAIYPLYAEPSDIPAQTVTLAPGRAQRARSNEDLLGPLVEEERAVSIVLALLQERVPASFTEVAPARRALIMAQLPGILVSERRRFEIDGTGLSDSEYAVETATASELDERQFLDPGLGTRIFAVTLDRLAVQAGEPARLIVVRRDAHQ